MANPSAIKKKDLITEVTILIVFYYLRASETWPDKEGGGLWVGVAF